MSRIALSPNASGTGTLTIAAPNTDADRTLTLPDATGTVNISGLANEVPAGSAGAPAIYPTGDTNTGVFFPAADTIAFSEGGAEAMRINSSGNVGIGVTSFSNYTNYKSIAVGGVVGGAIDFIASNIGAGANRAAQIFTVSGALGFATGASDAITERMRIDSAGRVTIPAQPYICRRVTTGSVTAPQLIPWDTEIGSSGIVYNTGTRRFTVPVAGRYKITGSFFKSGSAGSTAARVCLGVNSDEPGAAANLGQTYSGIDAVYHSMSFDVILSLSANDFFTFRLSDGPLYSAPSDQFNFMSAHMIG